MTKFSSEYLIELEKKFNFLKENYQTLLLNIRDWVFLLNPLLKPAEDFDNRVPQSFGALFPIAVYGEIHADLKTKGLHYLVSELYQSKIIELLFKDSDYFYKVIKAEDLPIIEKYLGNYSQQIFDKMLDDPQFKAVVFKDMDTFATYIRKYPDSKKKMINFLLTNSECRKKIKAEDRVFLINYGIQFVEIKPFLEFLFHFNKDTAVDHYKNLIANNFAQSMNRLALQFAYCDKSSEKMLQVVNEMIIVSEDSLQNMEINPATRQAAKNMLLALKAYKNTLKFACLNAYLKFFQNQDANSKGVIIEALKESLPEDLLEEFIFMNDVATFKNRGLKSS